jgi:hypothetical protein
MSSLEFASYSRFIGIKEGQRLYAWCVFVDARRQELEAIREIEYTLHPSFPDLVRIINDPTNCFALQSQGWDEFQLRIRTSFNDSSISKNLFYLNLQDDAWPRGGLPPATMEDACRKIYDALIAEGLDWRRLSTLAREAQISIEQTRSHLDDLARTRTVRPAYYVSLDNEELWGATSKVGLLPEPK